MSTRLLVPSGRPVHDKGGEMSLPSQVYGVGISPSCGKLDEMSDSVMVTAPLSLSLRAVAALADRSASQPTTQKPITMARMCGPTGRRPASFIGPIGMAGSWAGQDGSEDELGPALQFNEPCLRP